MNDRIVLRGVTAHGFHGVLAEEKRTGQTFVVDVTLTIDLAPAGRSDALTATVNYAEVADLVVHRITGPSFDLIERLAEVIADDVLALAAGAVEAVEVAVHKPEAPVGHPFADVEVRIERPAAPQAVIALGSNLGDRGDTLAAAVAALRSLPGLTVTAVSPIVATDPIGGPEQPEYLNAIALARTTLPPAQLLGALHRIEAEHGRTREVRWGARTLDLDLIQYGSPGTRDEVIADDDSLTLPHPRAAQRAFVLEPWIRADPRARLRVGHGAGGIRAVADLLDEIDRSGVRPGPAWAVGDRS